MARSCHRRCGPSIYGAPTTRASFYGEGRKYRDFVYIYFGVGVGGSIMNAGADGRYAVFSEAMARTSLDEFGDSNTVGAKLGVSMKW
ncbi:hypothetical protein LB566_22165 [Mesorhizobium sp. CA13]|uniref:hypothetical protein n=1 Tax=unclassified Mesorhizobium TaxID=325217 RepID=UPI0011275B0B|nr:MULTISPECIES: hypothetical protein [unclassified Mesorhizobium]MBZ9856509.1 hypothetical protein [Mesorhizobium sp. CA13]MBZ9965744.1 hypothetical protein [Mesorhizobium sp. BR1-1-2]MCA0011861.1 hypothetical protein [Mesorhizobium sp. B294B1A1]MCA0038115.1 hypothetical protein [Mesorhizobium sp. B292B1B]TPM44148.1 hypothetical protein FJ964_19800 [Mesorhizobium sp. B2-3-2]